MCPRVSHRCRGVAVVKEAGPVVAFCTSQYSGPVLQEAWEKLLDFVYPPLCCSCGTLLPRNLPLCGTCAPQVRRIESSVCATCGLPFHSPAPPGAQCGRCIRHPPAFRRARSAFLYKLSESTNPLARALARYKYGRLSSLCRPLGFLLQHGIDIPAGSYDLIVPVPLHTERLRWRGFNQALLLAKEAYGKARIAPFVLERTRPTRAQAELGRKDRLHNVRHAFSVPAWARARVAGCRVLVVDDVMTTGATLHFCSLALRKAGAAQVDAVVLARVALE